MLAEVRPPETTASSVVPAPSKPPLEPEQPEFGLYTAIKLYVYERLSQKSPHLENWKALVGSDPALSNISARRARQMVSTLTRNPWHVSNQFTDFVDVSSYFIRERLKNLNHGTHLARNGRGLRNAVTYRWSEPVGDSTMESFRHLKGMLGGRVDLSLDVYRLEYAFGNGEFDVGGYLRLFQEYRGRLTGRRWYQLSTRTPAKSMQLTKFLKGRLEELVAAGLVSEGRGVYRLTIRGHETANWFELFAFSVRYKT